MADLVQLLNEDGFLADGQPYESVWVSQALNRRDLGRFYTLPYLDILYSAVADTSIEVSGSGDGGSTWAVTQAITLVATGQTPGEVGRVAVPLRVSGTDLRIRFRFNQVNVSNVHVWIPPLIERGKHQYAVRSPESSS